MACTSAGHDFGITIYEGKRCRCGECRIAIDASTEMGYRVEGA